VPRGNQISIKFPKRELDSSFKEKTTNESGTYSRLKLSQLFLELESLPKKLRFEEEVDTTHLEKVFFPGQQMILLPENVMVTFLIQINESTCLVHKEDENIVVQFMN
jgi:hypothetical protein